MLERAARWLRFNLLYLRKPPWDTRVTPPELVEFAHRHAPGKALDLGCGTGTNLIYLAQLGWQVTGVDFALRAVETARRRLLDEKLPGAVILGNAANTAQFGSDHSLVLDIGCLHGLGESDRERYKTGIPGLLRRGGSYLLYVHLKKLPDQAIGVSEMELAHFSRRLSLRWREDSLDRFGRRAAWLEYTLEE